jgi:hypothetical protein
MNDKMARLLRTMSSALGIFTKSLLLSSLLVVCEFQFFKFCRWCLKVLSVATCRIVFSMSALPLSSFSSFQVCMRQGVLQFKAVRLSKIGPIGNSLSTRVFFPC